MDRFSEMIAKGVASREHKTFLPKTPEQDNIVRTYNNCFGLFTDTHMSKLNENEYVITGSLCSRPDRFDSFLYSVNFELGTTFKVNGKVTSLACFLETNGLKGCYECLNGDRVYKIYPCPSSACCIDPACGYGVCGMDCKTPYPVQLGEKLIETIGDILDESANLEELENKINECSQIIGSDWISFNTSKGFGLCSESTGKAILFDKVNESTMKMNQNDRADGFSHGPFFGMKAVTDTGRWLDVYEIRIEDKDIFGNPADKGMQYCTLVFGSLSKTKQITKIKKPKETAKENNWGYNWMPSPELLAEILKAFGSDKVSFDFNDKNLKGVNWRKYNVYI